jgi:hypothetical protein
MPEQQPAPATIDAPPRGRTNRRRAWVLLVLAGSLMLAAAHVQRPLYSSNQNTYFVHGLAQGGLHHLARDWLAQQDDHVPVFSQLVAIVYRSGAVWLFYALHILLGAIYAGALLLIARRAAGQTQPGLVWTGSLLALLTFLHAYALWRGVAPEMLGDAPLGPLLKRIAFLATNGLTEQYIYGPYFQPSAFGVLLLAAVALFAYDRPFLAIISAVAAAVVHPTYLLHAAALTAAFMLVLSLRKQIPKAIGVGALALLLVMPMVVYIVTTFGGAPPELVNRTKDILVIERIPHHAQLAQHFDRDALYQVLIAVAGIGLAFRSRALWITLAVCAGFAAVLSLIQVTWGSRGLALLFPWRLSAWLVPAGTAIILGQVLALLGYCGRKLLTPLGRGVFGTPIIAAAGVFLVASGWLGLRGTIRKAEADPPGADIAAHLAADATADDTYLIPIDWLWFRVTTGVPIFIDWKSHPYAPAAVVEWYERSDLARRFYAAKSPATARAALAEIRARGGVTHVITGARPGIVAELPECELVWHSGRFRIYRCVAAENERPNAP